MSFAKNLSKFPCDEGEVHKSDLMGTHTLMAEQDEGNSCGHNNLFRDCLKSDLLNFLVRSNACIKSQQIGEPELTHSEKLNFAADLLNKSPSQFLVRFGTKIKSEHLQYFSTLRCDNVVDFYYKKLLRFHNKESNVVDVKNKRFVALQKLINESSYFTEEEMKSRNPHLYEQLVGQYLTSKERAERAKDYSKMTYVGYLLDRIDRDCMNELLQKQKDEEDECMEEEDTDDEGVNEEKKEVDKREKDLLRQEFISSMYESFIEGKDKDIDYSSVELSDEYDCHQHLDRDDEDRYFDSETPTFLVMDAEPRQLLENFEEDELDIYMKKISECEIG